jgi:anti-sigma B factor antagonist
MIPDVPYFCLERHTAGSVTRVRFAGRDVVLHEEAARAVGDALLRLADDLAGAALVLSFTNVAYLSSTTLENLVALHKKLKAAGGKLVVVGLRPRLHELFRVTALDRVLDLRAEEPLEEPTSAPGGPGSGAQEPQGKQEDSPGTVLLVRGSPPPGNDAAGG